MGLPDDSKDSALHAAQIFIHLHGIEKNAHYENPNDLYSKMALELHYIIITAAKDKSFEHKIAGKIMEVLNENKVLGRKSHMDKPGFSAADQDVKIDFCSMATEDRHKFWTAYPKIADKTFVGYVARPVAIRCEMPAAQHKRVKTREVKVKDIKNN
jgi:hypothetical protein